MVTNRAAYRLEVVQLEATLEANLEAVLAGLVTVCFVLLFWCVAGMELALAPR